MTATYVASVAELLTEFIPEGRSALLPALHAVQDHYGYISEAIAEEVAQALKIPLSDVFGVIEFYAMFYRQPVNQTILHVCSDPACAMAGADAVYKRMARTIIEHEGKRSVQIERSPCLGLCVQAPAALVQGQATMLNRRKTWDELIAGKFKRPHTFLGGDIRLLTQNCNRGKTTNLEETLAQGGYKGLKKALSLIPTEVINQVKTAGLVGRGGAAFPTGLKWEGAAKAPGETKYVVCNGDEAEPGTFKDRVMMEDDPHRVLEGLIITAYAIGAHKGYWYIRGEYEDSFRSASQAIQEARSAGILGKNILGSSFEFDVELRRGAGAYICGEETALFESIEGKRGFPRSKPPFPTTFGLFGKPTVINNVETLSNVPLILEKGPDWYRSLGTEKSPGSKLFCVSGDVTRPGLYEVPFGVTVRHLLEDLAGGMRNGAKLQAILFGGAAGAFASQKDLDVRLSFEDLRAAGLPLGSGVITVFNETRDLRDVLFRLARFFADESCGKCYPCQLGTQRQYEIIRRLANHKVISGDRQRLEEIGKTMADSSLCGLGQTAGSAVLSAIRLWPELFDVRGQK
jgi:NADH-quinone oxidoreductase subunit F